MILLCWAAVILGMMVIGGQGNAGFSTQLSPQPPTSINYEVTFNAPSLYLGQNGSIEFHSTVNGTANDLFISLLQLKNGNASLPVMVLNVKQHICISDSLTDCEGASQHITTEGIAPGTRADLPIFLKEPPNNTIPSSYENLFFCVGQNTTGSTTSVCNFYSSVFSLGTVSGGVSILPSSVSFENPLPITSTMTPPILTLIQASTATDDAPTPASTSSALSITGTLTTTFTQSPTGATTAASSVTSSNSNSKKSSSLSTGAKVGIALGALAFVALLLLAALFCLRKKHSKRARNNQNLSQSPPEQVMLTRDMHTDSFSRNLMMMEKDRNPSTTTHMPETPIETPPRRQSTLSSSPYEAVPSTTPLDPIIPPSTIATANIPRRKPTQTTIVSHTSSSPTTETHTPPSAYEAYHDIPVYGDARHVPQIFTTSGERGAPSPFLGEETEGMSPEEVARLEEEERRIDAAIAAAEAGR